MSEAHAMVSLRGGTLVLLALRGGLLVGRRKVVRVVLHPGLRVELVPGIELTVVDLVLPATVPALTWDGHTPVPLVASAYFLAGDGELRLEAGFQEDAWANLWTSGAEGWRLRRPGQEARRLLPGEALHVAGHEVRLLDVPAEGLGVAPTVAAPAEAGPMVLVLRFDTVHLHREGQPSVHIPGIPARIVTELGRFAAPVPWEMVARPLWKGENDRYVLRQNWDRHLKALRLRLREAGVRDDLVRADGLGNIELFLRPEDRLVDEA